MAPLNFGIGKNFGLASVLQTPTYSIGQSTTSVNEGSSVTFTVTTEYVPNGTILYWTTNVISGTVNTSDFGDAATTGSFTITNNTGSIVRNIAFDATTEGSESFQIQVRTGSTSGTIVATSATVTINDTSQTPSPLSITYLVVAGGGGGASFCGGGGAGGFRAGPLTIQTSTNYTLTVGAGGGPGNGSGPGPSGNNSVFHTITSNGGGGGGQRYSPSDGIPGGSGGGASGWDAPSTPGTGGSGTPGQGNPGGNTPGPGGWGGAGGGGAGGSGSNGTGNNAGPGGPGSPSSITGSSVLYAGGGGGGSYNGNPLGTGGPGGGAPGSNGGGGDPAPPTVNATANTGGGGGGGNTTNGGSGGSGVVILRYPNSRTIANPGGGLSFSSTPVGSDTVTTFTLGTGNISWS